MAFDPVPWLVEGGAHHSAEVARLLANIATGAGEGVLNATDLRVLALTTPGTAVRVMPGAFAIKNRALAGENQSYLGRVVTEVDDLAVPASGSSGPRTHLVIARVENPYISGEPWGSPPDVENGPYVYPRLVSDVPITTKSVHELGLGYSAITLARITVPTNTATVTQSMITDLRGLINPITGPQPPVDPPDPPEENDPCPEVTEKTFFDVKRHPGDASSQVTSETPTAGFVNFPSAADWLIPIPEWATGADVVLQVANIRQEQGGAIGEYRVEIDNGAVYTTPVVYDIEHDVPEGGWQRQVLFAADTVAIPAGLRGKIKRFRGQIKITNDDEGVLRWVKGTVLIMQVVFKQQPSFD